MTTDKTYDKIFDRLRAEGKLTEADLMRYVSNSLARGKAFNIVTYGTTAPDWDKLTTRECATASHLLHHVVSVDELFYGRHKWWANEILSGPSKEKTVIPQITMNQEPDDDVLEMIRDCITYPMLTPEGRFRAFLVFLLYAFGFRDLKDEVDRIPESLLLHFYKTNDMVILQSCIFDHLGLYAEMNGLVDGLSRVQGTSKEDLVMEKNLTYALSRFWNADLGVLDKPELVSVLMEPTYLIGMSNHTINFNYNDHCDFNDTKDLLTMINLFLFAPHFVMKAKFVDEAINL